LVLKLYVFYTPVLALLKSLLPLVWGRFLFV